MSKKRAAKHPGRLTLPDSPFEPGSVFVPSDVEIRGSTVIWPINPLGFAVPRGSVLEQFRRLHTEASQRTCDFIRTFGAAWFCQHNLPSSHAEVLFGEQYGLKSCRPVTSQKPGFYQEDIEDYLSYSRGADAIVTAAGMVNAGRRPGDDVFQSFVFENRPLEIDLIAFPKFASPDGKTHIPERYLLDSARIRIADEVNLWVQVSQARPQLSWEPNRKSWSQRSVHSPLGVLGAIALALLATVPQSPGWLICSACGESYQPKRPAVPGRNHYCKNCRDKPKMWRLLKRQERARKKNPE
jgi:hypothetical protein